MHSSIRMQGAALFAVLTFGTVSLLAAGASIEAAQEAPLGSVVSVSGVVSVPSGAFEPNDDGFAIQDGKVGIYIHDSLRGGYALGQTVTVTGVLADNSGQLLGVNPTSIDVTGNHPVHPPKPTQTGDVNGSTEGSLVALRATVVDTVQVFPSSGALFHVDDGSGPVQIFVYTGTGAIPTASALQQGDEVDLTGFSGQFGSSYEVNPRFPEDISVRR